MIRPSVLLALFGALIATPAAAQISGANIPDFREFFPAAGPGPIGRERAFERLMVSIEVQSSCAVSAARGEDLLVRCSPGTPFYAVMTSIVDPDFVEILEFMPGAVPHAAINRADQLTIRARRVTVDY
jgi:hypothetical protein